ncbi:MAG: hypothetical protein KAV87_53105 [Desulfobacteraceae bacterium]|nr:hypothetical protein [Desulfobacteraceae bacterium]
MKLFCIGSAVMAFCLVLFTLADGDNVLPTNVTAATSIGSTVSEPSVEPLWMKTDTGTDTGYIVPCESLPVISAEDIPESEKEQMIAEVVMLWEMFFDDENASPSDPRRMKFQEYASYLVDSILLFQDRPTAIGGQLPKSNNLHALIATMVTFESSVTSGVIGMYKNKREVGLMQVHGKALAGFTREQVVSNPKLGLLLGIRWLAAQIPTCYPHGAPDYFSYEDWLGPLSVYAGGPNAIRGNGSCKRFDISRKRVNRMMMYEKRIDYEMSLRD